MTARPAVWNLPNILTVARIAITPVVAALPFIDGYWPKVACFVLFVAAAVTDVIDGRIARRDNLVTDLGKLLDPLADKLLLLATLGARSGTSRSSATRCTTSRSGEASRSGSACCCIGRELAMTVFRAWAQRRGVVIAAEQRRQDQGGAPERLHRRHAGLVCLSRCRPSLGWTSTPASRTGGTSSTAASSPPTLGIALTLTLYSFVVYLVPVPRLFR